MQVCSCDWEDMLIQLVTNNKVALFQKLMVMMLSCAWPPLPTPFPTPLPLFMVLYICSKIAIIEIVVGDSL